MRKPANVIAGLLDEAVSHAEVTNALLARRADVAPETVSRLRQRGTGDFATVARLMRSAGLRLVAVPASSSAAAGSVRSDHAAHDARSAAMHAVIAGKLLANPDLLATKVLPNIRRFKIVHAGTGTVRLLDQWEAAARSGVLEVMRLCLDPGERGQQLRQASPLTGLLQKAERERIHEALAP